VTQIIIPNFFCFVNIFSRKSFVFLKNQEKSIPFAVKATALPGDFLTHPTFLILTQAPDKQRTMPHLTDRAGFLRLPC
jgi:hypothetical protein